MGGSDNSMSAGIKKYECIFLQSECECEDRQNRISNNPDGYREKFKVTMSKFQTISDAMFGILFFEFGISK
jgi:hypothetical protein